MTEASGRADGHDGDGGRAARWQQLWQCASELAEGATRLRNLSQREPLVQHRPGYPHAGLGRPHADEVRQVLDAVQRGLEQVVTLLPAALPAEPLPGMGPDEQRDQLAKRAEHLRRLAVSLADEAFRPLPPLPKHAPPYLVEPPGHDLPGTKAVVVATGLTSLAGSLHNLLLASANAPPSGRSRG